MFGLGTWEIAAILVVALLVLGPDKLPQLARTLGKGLREMRRATNDLRMNIELDDVPVRPRPVVGEPDDPPAERAGTPRPSLSEEERARIQAQAAAAARAAEQAYADAEAERQRSPNTPGPSAAIPEEGVAAAGADPDPGSGPTDDEGGGERS